MAKKSSPRKAYTAKIELAFEHKGKREKIDPEKIVYIMVEHDYENQVLPTIYVSVSVNANLYTKIMKYKESAKFYLNIKIANKNSKCSISKNDIKGSFNYIPSSTNPNYQEDLQDKESTPDSTFKRITIGMVSIELTNSLRKSFNGIYHNIDTKTLIGKALEGTNCIIESIPYNKTYDSIMITPIASRYRMLEFIFEKGNFYDTKFRYFMDFEKSYLTSKKGDAISGNDGKLNSVIVDIRSVSEEESYYDGIEIKNGAYYLYMNPADSNVALNQGTEKVANQIVAVNSEDQVSTLDLDINNTTGSTTKQMFIRANKNNATLYKNELEQNNVIIELMKKHIDGSAFTPNRSILINNYDDYKKYNGKYLMVYKREFFKCEAGEFVLSCNVGLKKVGNIQATGMSASSNNTSGYASQSATKRSSSSNGSSTKR